MENAFLVAKTIAAIMAVVALIVWLVVEHRRKHPKICKDCAHLTMVRRHPCDGKTTYQCGLHGHFSKRHVPMYCRSYAKREEDA